MTLHRIAVKLLVKPFVWANQRPTQNLLTRTIRRAWNAL